MKNDYLNMLASLVLPAQILDYFLISGVEQTSQEIHISLDEKMNPKLSNDVHFESKGFMEAVNVTDFPMRDHKVILKIRCRRWTDFRTGKSFSIPIYMIEFLKRTAGHWGCLHTFLLKKIQILWSIWFPWPQCRGRWEY